MGSSVGGVGVLDKAVAVLAVLEVEPRSLAELVEATGLTRATAHRLAVALEHHGLVRRDDEGRFALGARLVALGRAASEGLSLVDAAGPALAELRDATGESVQLYLREGEVRVCVAALESPHGLRTIVPVGARLPLGAGSAGRLLAEPDALPRRGWVDSVGEREPGVASVSAPVLDADGRIVAAMSVSGPIGRTTRAPGRRYGAAVVAAARRLERDAGLRQE
ncbi:IclR family transcriptional regulator [Rhabdothermincola salaria]|uniref:IclR family transcriptional regulator n=1 Tax=Rhabdothermincola salaria TaxID=2903142 RepID=UPI001E5D4E56|nr:IclR family transcriptional regulator [Rhabdothermincola salaria]